MTHAQRNQKILKAIAEETERAISSKKIARDTLISEGIYTTRGKLRVEFGGGGTKRLCLRDGGGTVMQEFEIEDLRAWSRGKLQLPPDFVIGDNYLRRWWIVPRNPFANVYLHEILHSDDDRALHDHPWDNRTFVLEGGYIEHTPEGVFERKAGDVIARKASDAHRLEIPEGGRAVSIFMTGPVIREWGFHCPQGWRHWREFVDARDTGQIGKGCA